jgi:hypothetical protein
MKCYILQLTTIRKLTTLHLLYHTNNIFAIFLPVFTQYQLKFLVILAKRLAEDHDIPHSSRYLRNISQFFAYFSQSLPQPGSTLWTYCISYKMATGYLPRSKAAGAWR